MTYVRMLFENDADDATLTSTSDVGTLPVDYLQRAERAYVWRSTSTAAQTILGDFDSLVTVSGVALARHNLSASGTWRIRFYSGAGQTGSTLYDSGTISLLTRNGSHWFSIIQDARSFSIV